MKKVRNAKTDVEGVEGTRLHLQDVQKYEKFKDIEEIQSLVVNPFYIRRFIEKYNAALTKVFLSFLTNLTFVRL